MPSKSRQNGLHLHHTPVLFRPGTAVAEYQNGQNGGSVKNGSPSSGVSISAARGSPSPNQLLLLSSSSSSAKPLTLRSGTDLLSAAGISVGTRRPSNQNGTGHRANLPSPQSPRLSQPRSSMVVLSPTGEPMDVIINAKGRIRVSPHRLPGGTDMTSFSMSANQNSTGSHVVTTFLPTEDAIVRQTGSGSIFVEQDLHSLDPRGSNGSVSYYYPVANGYSHKTVVSISETDSALTTIVPSKKDAQTQSTNTLDSCRVSQQNLQVNAYTAGRKDVLYCIA